MTTKTAAILARIETDEHAEAIREELLDRISDYATANRHLMTASGIDASMEANEAAKVAYNEILRLSFALRDVRKEG